MDFKLEAGIVWYQSSIPCTYGVMMKCGVHNDGDIEVILLSTIYALGLAGRAAVAS